MTLTIKVCLFGILFLPVLIGLDLSAKQKDINSDTLSPDVYNSDTVELKQLNVLKVEYFSKNSMFLTLNTINRIFELSNSILLRTKSQDVINCVQRIKADSYYTLGIINRNKNQYDLALGNFKSSLQIEKKLGSKKSVADLYSKIGFVYKLKGSYFEAIDNYNIAKQISLSLNDKKSLEDLYNNIGNVYRSLGIYDEAIKAHFNSIKIAESIFDSLAMARSYNNIGNIYDNKKEFKAALDNYFMSLKIKKLIGDKYGIGVSYGNIGLVYEQQNKWDDALEMYLLSLDMMLAYNDKRAVAVCYNNLGVVYYQMRNYKQALKQYFESISIRKELSDSIGLAGCYGNIGDVYRAQKKYEEAERYLQQSKKIAAEYKHLEYLKHACGSLVSLYKNTSKFKEALENCQLYKLYSDSIDNEKSKKKIVEAQLTYDFDKKEEQLKAEQEKKDIIAKQRLQQKEQQRNYFIIGFVLVAILSAFIFKEYKQKQRANFIIAKQKEEVELAKQIIEEKNKDITDSINYATNIQQAILPLQEDIYSMFPESFILFKPKDIVSGDFYFFFKKDNTAYIAAADCTGHGVPGAFMSLIGSEKLKDAVRETHDTSIVLQYLNQEMKKALKQSENSKSTRDGMDIALCLFDKDKNELSYSGANRPLWIVKKQKDELIEIRATKAAIGGFTDSNQIFGKTSILLEKGDTFYLSTDGYADQFGGKESKKLMVKKFKEQLLKIQHLSMAEQRDFLNSFIVDWKGNNEQVDDVLIIGVRV